MKKRENSGQILLFPPPVDSSDAADSGREGGGLPANHSALNIVISGSFRKDLTGLTRTFEELRDSGFHVLSPTNTTVVSEEDGFVYMSGEQAYTPEEIEIRHLEAIRRADFVWLHSPDGYVGPSAAVEVGFACASGVRVYSTAQPREKSLRTMVTVVPSPTDVAALHSKHPLPPVPALQSFQAYYARAAVKRGYEKESARDTLLLMVEEVGELARAVRKRHKLRRDGDFAHSPEAHELADIFIYVVHMANVLGFDLSDAVHSKEQLNIEKFLARLAQ